jgi:divalent metal cation (Fe/Co/Zn/Cd) transporter
MSTVVDRVPALERGILIEWLSAAWMVLEAVVAVAAGVLAHSVALVAYGADSVIELVAGAAVLSRLYVEARAGDAERVDRAERAASWVVGLSLLALAVYIVVASVVSLVTRSRPETSILGIAIAAASSILMPILASAKKRVGRACSKALVSDGSCSMVCAYMSWILLAGVGATALFGWWWIDSVAALGFSWFVVREGLEAVKEARETEPDEGQ